VISWTGECELLQSVAILVFMNPRYVPSWNVMIRSVEVLTSVLQWVKITVSTLPQKDMAQKWDTEMVVSNWCCGDAKGNASKGWVTINTLHKNKSRHNFINNVSSVTYCGFASHLQAEHTIVVWTIQYNAVSGIDKISPYIIMEYYKKYSNIH
jgi:hypothetical protein